MKAALEMRTVEPPRIGWVVAAGEALRVDRGRPVRAGRLVGHGPSVKPVGGGKPPVPAGVEQPGWPQLSFLDAPVDQVLEHSQRGRWHYHDRRTAFLHEGLRINRRLPDPATGNDGPLFFDRDGRLRYRTDELRAFGYSAGEVLEHGLPDPAASYPVAAPSSAGGLWLELSPGRVVELRASLLHGPSQRESALDGLAWSLFGPGDLVTLQHDRNIDTGYALLRLLDWRPGPRGWFESARALLPASTDDTGRCVLGGGSVALTWSGEPLSGTVWLGADNATAPFSDDVCVGDVVVLGGRQRGGVYIHGAEHLGVQLADDWEALGWMREAIVSDGSSLWRLLGNHLACRVIAADDGAVTVRPTCTSPGGNTLTGRVLGLLDDHRALLRCGTALLPVPLHQLLPGVPTRHREAVAERLAAREDLVWLVRRGTTWQSPVRKGDGGEHSVRPLLAVGDGLVAVSEADLGLEWVPINELGWIGDAKADSVLTAVGAVAGTLVVRARPGGHSSLLDTSEGARIAQAIEAHDELRVVPRVMLPAQEDGVHRYLATVFPGPVVLSLECESERRLGELMPVRVERDLGPTRAVPVGEARTRLVLSPWLVRELRERRRGGLLRIDQIREVGLAHNQAFRTALTGDPREVANGSYGVAERLVASVRAQLDDGELQSPDPRILSDWLGGAGQALLLGRPDGGRSADLAWEVPPALAAVLLLDAYGRHSEDPDGRQLAVHALRATGLAAAGSLHQEVLLRAWITADGDAHRAGTWSRLRSLDLGGRTSSEAKLDDKDPYVVQRSQSSPRFDGKLTAAQLEQLRNACRGSLMLGQPDVSLGAVARSMLFAVGEVPEVWGLMRDVVSTELLGLVDLARSLTPGDGVPVAQSRLSDGQVEDVVQRMRRAVGASVPLSLIPGQSPRLTKATATWVQETVVKLLSRLGG